MLILPWTEWIVWVLAGAQAFYPLFLIFLLPLILWLINRKDRWPN